MPVRARNLRTRVPKGSALKTISLFKMWPLEWDGGRVRQTRSFDWKIMRREHEKFSCRCVVACRMASWHTCKIR